jgi:hypothetical protein
MWTMSRYNKWVKEVAALLVRLRVNRTKKKRQASFVVSPRAQGLPVGLSYDNVEALIEALEGADHK